MKKIVLMLAATVAVSACHGTGHYQSAPLLEEDIKDAKYLSSYHYGHHNNYRYRHNNQRVLPTDKALYFTDTTYTPPYVGLENPHERGSMPHLPRHTYRPFQDVPNAYAYDQARNLPPLFWSRQFQHNIDEAMLSAPKKALYRFNVDGQDYHWVMRSAMFSHPYKAIPCREGALYMVSRATLPVMVGDYTLCRVGPRHEWLPNTL
ncbi:MAG: hypothetical protein VX730_02125 [Pseudomonadota bacterium]|nr:hypothetical protein [Pseudomonadota bacterium]